MVEIICYDEDSKILENFVQWDLNRTITIRDIDLSRFSSAPEVHFSNSGIDYALTVQSTLNTGAKTISVKVPNILLQSPYRVMVYFYDYNSNSSVGKTLYICKIPMVKRNKPDRYDELFTENISGLSLSDLKRLLNGGGGSGGISPTASVSKSGNVASITIKDYKGTTYAEVRDGKDGKSAYEYAREVGYTGSESAFANALISGGTGGSGGASSEELDALTQQINDMQNKMADLMYEEMAIKTFTATPSKAEKGSTVRSVSLAWSYNQTPTSVYLTDASISVNDTSKAISTNLTTTKTYTLTATDSRGKSASKSVTVSFCNGVYWGVSASTNVTSSFISGLSKELLTSRKKTFTVNAGATQYIYFALPTSYGTPNFNVKGFDGGFEKVASLSYTNQSNYTESYDVWRSDNVGLGSTTVVVS